MSFTEPSYLELYHQGELQRRAGRLNDNLRSCRLCPRACGVNRLAGETGYCRAPAYPVVARACIHRGEEPALSGATGIGNLFFAHCNLHCVYCQNFQISQLTPPVIETQTVNDLASLLLHFQQQSCGRIGLVTAVHFLPMILDALIIAIPQGFRLPLVYNTNAYDAVETLQLLEGIIDIYLPDLKYADNAKALKYSDAPDYVRFSRKAVREMYRQIGATLYWNDDHTVRRGCIIRHLVLPDHIAGTYETLEWIAESLSPRLTLSLMAQYYPAYRSLVYPELNRPISEEEYLQSIHWLDTFGLENGWIQELHSRDYYRPDFHAPLHPFEFIASDTKR